MEYLLIGIGDVFSGTSLLWVGLGVLMGYVLGAIPGLGKATGVAVSIPLTFYLDPVSALGLLIGIAKGSGAGSAVSAILLNTPGEPSSAPTALDGYPLARQGIRAPFAVGNHADLGARPSGSCDKEGRD